jgi:hypothetical protein
MRYLFHVPGNGCIYLDEVSSHLGNAENAEAHALFIANELASDGSCWGLEVCVIDHRADELTRCRSPASRRLGMPSGSVDDGNLRRRSMEEKAA